MNENIYLILINGKDKTTDIESIDYKNGQYLVVFDNYKKVYSYGLKNVRKISKSKTIYVNYMEVIVSGEHIYNVNRIVYFKDIAKLFFNDKSIKLCYSKHIKVVKLDETHKSSDVLKYMKEVADALRIKVDDDSSFLGKQFSKMLSVNNNSVLYDYIYHKKQIKQNMFNQLILPFGLNISQEKATRNAFNNKISVIEGPPGTGKTQTILNIIANSIIRNNTVVIVSNNNSATKNIQEKLDEYSLSVISAFLGSKENKNNFIESQSGVYPDMENWRYDKRVLNNLSVK